MDNELTLNQLREEAQKDLEAFSWLESRYPNHTITLTPKPKPERRNRSAPSGRPKGNASQAQRDAAAKTWAFAKWYNEREEMESPSIARQTLGEMRHGDPLNYSKLLAEFERIQKTLKTLTPLQAHANKNTHEEWNETLTAE